MTPQTAFIKSSDNINLFSQVWKPNQLPDCVICLVHGIGEHSSRYDDWAKRFVSNNIALVAFDQRLNIPLLLLHESSDLITSHYASQKFAANAGELCQFHLFKGVYHELQNNFCKDEVFDLILRWIHKNVTTSLY